MSVTQIKQKKHENYKELITKCLSISIKQIIMYSIDAINFTHIFNVHSHQCQIFTGIDYLNHNPLETQDKTYKQQRERCKRP